MEEQYINKYIQIVREFVEGDSSASEFSTKYMSEFKNDDVIPDKEIFKLLNYLFARADAYCEPELREDVIGGIDEKELEKAASETLNELEDKVQSNK